MQIHQVRPGRGPATVAQGEARQTVDFCFLSRECLGLGSLLARAVACGYGPFKIRALLAVRGRRPGPTGDPIARYRADCDWAALHGPQPGDTGHRGLMPGVTTTCYVYSAIHCHAAPLSTVRVTIASCGTACNVLQLVLRGVARSSPTSIDHETRGLDSISYVSKAAVLLSITKLV